MGVDGLVAAQRGCAASGSGVGGGGGGGLWAAPGNGFSAAPAHGGIR